MKIAELFINLGVKGNDSANKALGGVKSGLSDVKSMAFETKAMIAAVVYGLERMMSGSAQAGMGLNQFATFTGKSAEMLQKWQYAGRRAGATAEEVAGSFKSVQASMLRSLQGEGAPAGYSMIANKVGLDRNRLRDTEYVMKQLQKFAQMVPADIANDKLKSFGLSEGTITAMRQGVFNDKNFAAAPIRTDSQIQALSKVQVALGDAAQKFQMGFDKFTMKHGAELIRDFEKITKAIFGLADALTTLAEKLKVFQLLSKVVDLTTATADSANKQLNAITNPSSYKSPLEPGKTGYIQMWKDAVMNDMSKLMNALAPEPKAISQGSNVNANVSVTQNFQHDGKDHRRVGDAAQKGVQKAFQGIPTRSQKY